MFLHKGADPADPRAHINAQALGRHLPQNSALLHCLRGSGLRILCIKIGAADLRLIHAKPGRIKLLYLCCYLYFIVLRIKAGNWANAADTIH